MIAGKVWGRTQDVFVTPAFEVHRILVAAGHRCSRHLHQTKFNGFFIERGHLKVTVWQPTGTVDVTELGPGDSMVVPPGVDHQFEARVDTIAFEAYWTELRADDIVRKNTGE